MVAATAIGAGPTIAAVVPSAGRPSLSRLLDSLAAAWPGGDAAGSAPALERVIVVDDRPRRSGPLLPRVPPVLAPSLEIVAGPAAGPAAARNAGWRHARAAWIAFLDDDVVVPDGWPEALRGDLDALAADVAGSQGRIDVPLPAGRAPTDRERDVAGLAGAAWATADMAYRRCALAALGGFDERFPRAYREDADLALRARRAGWRLVRGRRTVIHPVRAEGALVSLRRQAGNADDALMRALHGGRWREQAQAPRGALREHLATTGALAIAALALAAAARGAGSAGAPLAAAAAATSAVRTARFAWRRIAPGPRTPAEVAAMALTSALIPPLAVGHRLRGEVRARRLVRADGPRPRPEAVLLDRDGTLVVDVPYNGDPDLVRPVPGAADAVRRLREARLKLAVVSNQSGVGRGLLTAAQVAAVNRRVEELLGPVGPWIVCLHAPEDGCACRKPRPGLLLEAARRLDVAPERCALIGDIGADVDAARAAGARAILVPTPVTRAEEVARAPEVARDLRGAVDLLLGECA